MQVFTRKKPIRVKNEPLIEPMMMTISCQYDEHHMTACAAPAALHLHQYSAILQSLLLVFRYQKHHSP